MKKLCQSVPFIWPCRNSACVSGKPHFSNRLPYRHLVVPRPQIAESPYSSDKHGFDSKGGDFEIRSTHKLSQPTQNNKLTELDVICEFVLFRKSTLAEE